MDDPLFHHEVAVRIQQTLNYRADAVFDAETMKAIDRLPEMVLIHSRAV